MHNDWYLIKPQPTMNNELENDEWNDWVTDSFDEALTETPLGETVKLCKGQYDGETGLFETEFETQAVVQNKTFDAYTQGWKRQILTRISDMIADYKYVKVLDTKHNEQIYIIMTMPDSNTIYTKAVIHECNYTLKWQDEETGQIYYYPSYTADATQYNTGVETARNIVQTGYIQLMSWVSLDEITVELQRDKRMFIDYATKHPDTYIITSMSKVPYSYNEMRIMRITFTECEFNPKTDRIDLMLCDYIDPGSIPHPNPINITFSGSPSIRIGGRKTFTAETESEVVFSIINPASLNDKLTMTQTGNKCIIKCVNEPALVGFSFKIEVTGNGQRSELSVDVIGAV
jgi:hypothetical protein